MCIRDRSYGFIDQVGQLFYDPYNGMTGVYAATNFKYTDQAISETVDGIWSKAYECIMYVNNVIENVEKEDVAKDPDYTVIRGEAYALRAFLHFDLMRLFCYNIKINSVAGGVPYSYSVDLENKRIYTLKECYDNVPVSYTHLVAAVVVAFVGGLIYWQMAGSSQPETKQVAVARIEQGGTRAVLITGTGKHVVLQGLKDTCLNITGMETLNIGEDGSLKYSLSALARMPEWHTLSLIHISGCHNGNPR